eukprot:scaffold4296_cov136-Isochrysis_galbana.AAC.2
MARAQTRKGELGAAAETVRRGQRRRQRPFFLWPVPSQLGLPAIHPRRGGGVIPLRDSPLASRPPLAPPPAPHHPLPLRLPTPMFNLQLRRACGGTTVPVREM